MQNTDKLASMVRKYRANKERVPPEELKTKYKVAFEKLAQDIRNEAERLLKIYTLDFLDGIMINSAYEDELVEEFNKSYSSGHYSGTINKALLERFDVKEFEDHAKKIRHDYIRIFQNLFQKYICVRATETDAKIYNDLTREFYNPNIKTWYRDREELEQPGVRIFYERSRRNE